MSKYKLTVNDQVHEVDVSPQMPLLWVLRDKLKLTDAQTGMLQALARDFNPKIAKIPTVEGLQRRMQATT